MLKHASHPTRLKLHPFLATTAATPSDLTPQTATTTSLIRVYYDLEQGVQTYRSIIISPVMKANEVLKCALSVAAPTECVDDYSLMLVTPEDGKK